MRASCPEQGAHRRRAAFAARWASAMPTALECDGRLGRSMCPLVDRFWDAGSVDVAACDEEGRLSPVATLDKAEGIERPRSSVRCSRLDVAVSGLLMQRAQPRGHEFGTGRAGSCHHSA